MSLKAQIESDVESSLLKSGLPNSNGIHHIALKFRSKIAHEFLMSAPLNLNTSPDGKIWLEIEVIDLPDKESPGIITQTSVFDMKTNNKLSEFGQRYGLKKYGVPNKMTE